MIHDDSSKKFIGFDVTLEAIESAFRRRKEITLEGHVSAYKFFYDRNGEEVSLTFKVNRFIPEKKRESWEFPRYNYIEYEVITKVDGKVVSTIIYLDTLRHKAYIELPT